MIKKFFILLGFFSMFAMNAQSGNIGMNTTSPKATLEIKALPTNTNKGVLFPQLTDAEINAMSAPPEGLMVYNTDKKCLSIWGKRSPTDAVMQWSCLYQSSTGSGSSGFVNVIQMKPEFPRKYDSEGLHSGFGDIIETADEGYLFMGVNNTNFVGDYQDYNPTTIVVKTNKKGYIEWTNKYNGAFRRVIELSNGDFMFVGSAGAGRQGSNDTERPFTQITSQFGRIISTNLTSFTFPLLYGVYNDIVKLPNGTFVLVGGIKAPYPANPTYLYIRNIDGNGNMIWEKQIAHNSSYLPQFKNVVADGNGNFYVVGEVYANNLATPNATSPVTSYKAILFKYDSSGNELLRKYMETDYSPDNTPVGLTLAEDGNLLIGLQNSKPLKLFKMNSSDGSVLWSRYSDGSGYGYVRSLSKDTGGFISVINLYTSSPTTIQSGIAKLDNDGNILWLNSSVPTPPDRGTVKPLKNGGYIYMTPWGLYVFKLNAVGQLIPE